jgi:hypothetical protein
MLLNPRDVPPACLCDGDGQLTGPQFKRRPFLGSVGISVIGANKFIFFVI